MQPRDAALRAVGHLSRRFDRPEMLAAVNRAARRDLRDEIVGNALLAALLGRDSVFVDVGSNNGQWLEAATRCAPDGRHAAFEPVPALAAVVRNRFPHVDVSTVALSDHSGTGTFTHFPAMSGFSGLQRRPDVDVAAEQITVRVARLDDEISGPVSVLKIDVEGAELPVFRGAQMTLRESRPTLIFEHQPTVAALYGTTSDGLWELLAGAGYRIYDLQGHGPYSSAGFVERAAQDVVNWLGQPR
jgi:FkbM family methyltransferase